MNPIDQLKTSAELIQQLRPSYQEILGFWKNVFIAQEESRTEIILEPVTIEQSLLDLKKNSEMPLIDPSQFQVDTDSASQLLVKICQLAILHAPNLSENAAHLKSTVDGGGINPQQLFDSILSDHQSQLENISRQLDIPVSELMLFGYHSIIPSLSICAQQLVAYLDDAHQHIHGYCPICGNQPDLAILDEAGKKSLTCHFCRHQWITKRMGCSFCDNLEPDKQQYFYSAEEKEYRVNLCDNCNKYLKVVDLRHMNRYFYPALESITTLHLDMKAREQGFHNDIGE